MRRLIEESAHDEDYHDEPGEGPNGRVLEEPNEEGVRVVPSPLVEHGNGNEWRDEGRTN